MKKLELSKRLHKASEFVVLNQPIVDVGSDHAYLPIYLVQEKMVPYAIAGEIAEGPLKNAESKARQYKLEDNISVRLGNGLEVVKPSESIGTIFICGMGGALISDILKNGRKNNKLSKNARLVLQPNNAEEHLRKVLVEANYKIIKEAIIEENDKIYEIIVADYTEEFIEYTSNEFLFGPQLIKEQSNIFVKKWELEIQKLEKVLGELEKTTNKEKVNFFNEKIQQIKQVIS